MRKDCIGQLRLPNPIVPLASRYVTRVRSIKYLYLSLDHYWSFGVKFPAASVGSSCSRSSFHEFGLGRCFFRCAWTRPVIREPNCFYCVCVTVLSAMSDVFDLAADQWMRRSEIDHCSSKPEMLKVSVVICLEELLVICGGVDKCHEATNGN